MKLMHVALVSLLVVAATGANAQISPKAGGYLFRQKFTKGGKIQYITEITQGMGSSAVQGISMTMPFVQRVTDVSRGIASISVSVGPASLNKKSMGKVSTYQMKVDTQGKVVGGPAGGAQGVTAFPVKPIKFGQTWTATVPAPRMGGEQSTATAVYKFLKMGSYRGKRAAVVAVTISTNGGFALTGGGTSYLSAEDGSVLGNVMKLTAGNPTGQGAPITVNVSVRRG